MPTHCPPPLLAILLAVATLPVAGANAQTVPLPNDDPILESGDRREDRWRRSAPRYLRRDDDPYPWLDWAERDPSAGKFRAILPSKVSKELKRLGAEPEEFLDNAESTHFQIVIGRDGRVSSEWTEERRKAYLNTLEWYYHAATHRLGLILSTQSWRSRDRDPKRRWKINIISSNSGVPGMLSSGTAVSVSDDALGLHGVVVVGVSPEPLFVGAAHELGHGARFDLDHTLWKQLGPSDALMARTGFLSESFANWFARRLTGAPLLVGPPRSYQRHAHKDPDSKFQNYHQWFFWEHMTSEEGLGLDRTWELFRGERLPTSAAAIDETAWERGRRLEPDFDAELVESASRVATLDYPDRERLLPKARYAERESRRVLPTYPIERLDQPGWYDVPPWKAPSPLGYNLIPLSPREGVRRVQVELAGYTEPERGSAWGLRLVVARGDYSDARYSAVGLDGKVSIEVRPKEELLFLVVVALPEQIDGSYRRIDDVPESEVRESWVVRPLPYALRVVGASIRDLAAESVGYDPDAEAVEAQLLPHPKGGGLVASTADVAPSAFVGPQARVLGYARVEAEARVEGRARVEDFAWLEAGATVRDAAWVRDYAWIRRRAVIEDQARVEEFGRVDEEAVVGGRARVREMGALAARQRMDGTAILEGLTEQDNRIGGNALLDGNLFGGKEEVRSGVHLTTRAAAEERVATGGLVLDYAFEVDHPYLAWDTHGENHAFLAGDARQVADRGRAGGVLELDGDGDYLRLPHGALDLTDLYLSFWVYPQSQRSQPLLTGLGQAGDGTSRLALDTHLRLTLETPGGDATLAGPSPLTPGRWSRVSLEFAGNRVSLAVDGEDVAATLTEVNPEDLAATTVLLGRDEEGRHFEGRIDALELFRGSRIDQTPPQPDPAAWNPSLPPRATGPHSISMRAGRAVEFGLDGRVEYQFEVLTGDSSKHLSPWIERDAYKLTDLEPSTLHACRFRTRDLAGNTGRWSATLPVVTLANRPSVIQQPATESPIGFVFEAEDAQRRAPGASGSQWETIDEAPWWTAHSLSGLGLRATAGAERDDRPFERPELGALLEYVIRFERPGSYRLTLLGGGADAKQNSVSGSFDYLPLRTFEHISVKAGKFEWFSRALATKSFVTFDVPVPGPYVLQLRAREAGTLLDRIQIQPAELDRRFPPADFPAIASSPSRGDGTAPEALEQVVLDPAEGRLAWNASSAPDLAGYGIYIDAGEGRWSLYERILPPSSTAWSIPSALSFKRLAIGAVDDAGNAGPLRVVESN